MSVRFSEALSRTYQVTAAQDWHTKLEAVTIIRDVMGKVHLYLEGGKPTEQQQSQLSQALAHADALGPYWSEDIWLSGPESNGPGSLLATMIRDQRVSTRSLTAWFCIYNGTSFSPSCDRRSS